MSTELSVPLFCRNCGINFWDNALHLTVRDVTQLGLFTGELLVTCDCGTDSRVVLEYPAATRMNMRRTFDALNLIITPPWLWCFLTTDARCIHPPHGSTW